MQQTSVSKEPSIKIMYIKEVLDMYHPAEATLAGSEKPENCLRDNYG